MDRTPIEKENIEPAIDFIFQNAFGNPIIMDTAPSNAQLKANTWAKNGNDIYIKFADGGAVKISGTAID